MPSLRERCHIPIRPFIRRWDWLVNPVGLSRCAEAVRGSTEGNTACPGAGRSANRSQTESVEKREEEICLVTRRRTADRAEARRVFAVRRVVSCSGRDHEGRRMKLLQKKGLKGAAVSKKCIGLGSSGRSYVGANRPGGLPTWKIVRRKTIRFIRTRLGCIRLLTREVKTEIPAQCRFHGDPSCPSELSYHSAQLTRCWTGAIRSF
jgi:hypothetical protein